MGWTICFDGGLIVLTVNKLLNVLLNVLQIDWLIYFIC